ncbi:MAG: DUF3489 domain-containing protein, partial [Henriciella sp.]|nr:DUF3489 domain-containing protein [Henriciella sp.]
MTDTISPPKTGTKEAKLVSRLSRSGATLAQLSGLLEWQPHTVRAALTRLRGRGYIIDRIAKTERSAAKFKIRKP